MKCSDVTIFVVPARIVASFICLGLCASVCQAQTGNGAKAEKELPKTGSLSTSVQTGSTTSSIPDIWGGNDIAGTESPPVSGSVSRTNSDSWRMRVFNNSEDPYAVDLSVIQKNAKGTTVKTDSFSYRLRPGANEERTIPSGLGAREAELTLRNYKNLSPKKKDEAQAATTPPAQSPASTTTVSSGRQ